MMRKTFFQIISLLATVLVLIFFGIVLSVPKSEKSAGEISEKTNREMSGKLVKSNSTEIKGEPIDISDISKVPITALTIDDYGHASYTVNNIKRRVVHNNHPVTNLYFSPTNDKFGYIENFDIFDETIPYEEQVVLHIVDIDTKKTKEVYSGSFRTSGWEWFSEDEVLVYYNCGTECKALYKIDVSTGEKRDISENFGYGVGYQWSPDKNFISAYHYTKEYGILVGDSNGNIIFRLLHDPAPEIKSSDVSAQWSSDSTKIALVIKKEYEEKMEILVLDKREGFEPIFQEDLVGAIEDIKFSWQKEGKVLVYEDGKGRREKIFE